MNSIIRLMYTGIKYHRGKNLNGICDRFKFLVDTFEFSTLKKPDLLLQNFKTILPQKKWMGTYITIKHIENKFLIEMNEKVAELKYSIHDGVLDIKHTKVPKELGGHGLGKLLAKEALEFGVQNGLILKISCGFVQHYINEYEPHYLKYILH